MDTERLDRALGELKEKKDAWVQCPLNEKVSLLRQVLAGIERSAERLVQLAGEAKRVAPGGRHEAEDWLGGPVTQARTTRLLLRTLESLAASGEIGLPAKAARQRQNGRVALRVFPEGTLDKLMLGGFQAELWLEEETTLENWRARAASFYKQTPPPAGKVALVLGAGNVASIGFLDVLHKLFVEGQVCLLKFNPVNAYLFESYSDALSPLIRAGFLRLCEGGVDVGAYLCEHEDVEEIHITGSHHSHDAIVWGVGEEAARRRESGERKNTRRITSELGNVSPLIIFPGAWSESQLRFQAQNIATQMTNNAGFNCNAARVLILHRSWPQRRAFLDLLRSILADLEPRYAYYPGAAERQARFLEANPEGELIGSADQSAGQLPWAFVAEVDPEDHENIAFREESFCGFTVATSLEAESPESFLEAAVEFANERVWGSLNVTLIVDPKSEARYRTQVEAALEELRFGSVLLNHWAGLSYGLGSTAWGAYPGHSAEDIQSGIGFVHNSHMIEGVEKTVIRGPFKVSPHPPWFVTHRNALGAAKALFAFEMKPSVARLLGLSWQAIRG